MRNILTFLLLFPYFIYGQDTPQKGDFDSIYKILENYPSEMLEKKGRIFFNRNEKDSALVCFTIISNRYMENMSTYEKNRCAHAYNNCGLIYFLYSNYAKAYTNFFKAEEIGDESVKKLVYNNIASIFYYYGDYAKSEEYLKKSYDLSMRNKDWDCFMDAFNNLINQNLLIDSLKNIEKQLLEFKQLDIPQSHYYKYILENCNGMLNILDKNYPQAIFDFNKSLVYTDSLWMPERFIMSTYANIAKAYSLNKTYDSAIIYTRKREVIAQKNDYTEEKMQAYEALENYYNKIGNEKKAIEYRYKFLNIKDSALNAKVLGKIKDMQSFIEIEKIETKVHKLTTEQKQKNRLLAIISTAFVLITLSLFWVYRQNRRLEEKNKKLFQKNMEIMASEEAERQIRKKYEPVTIKSTHENTETNGWVIGTEENTQPQNGLDSSKSLTEDDELKHRAGILNEEQKNSLLNDIKLAMDDPQVFCQQEFTIEKLATLVDSNSKYVSQVINDKLNKNFNTFLNEYRISEARKRLLDSEHYRNLTIEAIAAELGFKSRSNFNLTFKKVTGLTPTEYLKMAKTSMNDYRG